MAIRILRLHLKNFRCFSELTFYPKEINVLVGPNNIGKTTILEALFLALSPEARYLSSPVNEYDFFSKNYLPPSDSTLSASPVVTAESSSNTEPPTENIPDRVNRLGLVDPTTNDITIEVTLGPLTTVNQKNLFPSHLEAWDDSAKKVISLNDVPNALDIFPNCVRIAFVAWYEPEEDDLDWRTVYVHPDNGRPLRERNPVERKVLRELGFLMYRDFRISNRPLTLSPRSLFQRLLTAYQAKPRALETLLSSLDNVGDCLTTDDSFAQILQDYQDEINRLLPFPKTNSEVRFDVTSLTRGALREVTQAFVQSDDQAKLPLEAFGAGTRCISSLAILALVARKRGHAIMAIEEPETFLYPSAQRAIVTEIRTLATQLFLTTHSPYTLDLFGPDEISVVSLNPDGHGRVLQPKTENIKQRSRYKRLFRSGLSEAILSPRALLVEGPSDSVFIRGFAEIASKKSVISLDFDREGVAFVEGESIGELTDIAEFLVSVDVETFITHDHTTDEAEQAKLASCSVPAFDLHFSGMEKLLATELQIDTIDQVLSWATSPSLTGLKQTPSQSVLSKDESIRRKAFFRLLKKNKTAVSLAQKLFDEAVGKLDIPNTLLDLFNTLSQWIQNSTNAANS